MAEPIGALRAELSANAAQFEADMKRARNAVRDSSSRMTKHMKRLRKGFDSAVKGLFSLRTAAVTAAGAAGLFLLTKRVMATADEIGKTADKLGIGTEALQEYRHAADMAGLAQSTFDMALQRFTRRASEAANGTGEAKAALAELGIQLRDSNGNMRSSEDLLADVADAFTRVKSPADRLRLAFKLFDSEGAGMVNMLRNGSKGLNDMRQEARDLGLVLSDQIVRDAERFSDQMSRLETMLQAGLARNLSSLIPVITGIANAFIAALPHVKNFFDILQRNEVFKANRAVTDARDRVRELREELERVTDPGSGKSLGGGFLGKSVEELKSSLETAGGNLSDEAKQVMDELEQAEQRFTEAVRRLGQLQSDRDEASRGKFITEVPTASIDVDAPTKKNVNSDAVQQALESANEFERAMKAKQDAISGTVEEAIRGGAEDGARGMANALLRSLRDNFIRQAAKELSGLFSGSGTSGLFGAIGAAFGGQRAFGGPIMPGKSYLVGERGPEIVRSNSYGQVIPNNRIGEGKSGDQFNFNINAQGAEPGVEQRIRRGVTEAVAMARADRIESRRRARP